MGKVGQVGKRLAVSALVGAMLLMLAPGPAGAHCAVSQVASSCCCPEMGGTAHCDMPAPSTVTADCCGPAGTPGMPVAGTLDGSRVKDAPSGSTTIEVFALSPTGRTVSSVALGVGDRDPAPIPLYTLHVSLLI